VRLHKMTGGQARYSGADRTRSSVTRRTSATAVPAKRPEVVSRRDARSPVRRKFRRTGHRVPSIPRRSACPRFRPPQGWTDEFPLSPGSYEDAAVGSGARPDCDRKE
jgi:hypothetical protein